MSLMVAQNLRRSNSSCADKSPFPRNDRFTFNGIRRAERQDRRINLIVACRQALLDLDVRIVVKAHFVRFASFDKALIKFVKLVEATKKRLKLSSPLSMDLQWEIK